MRDKSSIEDDPDEKDDLDEEDEVPLEEQYQSKFTPKVVRKLRDNLGLNPKFIKDLFLLIRIFHGPQISRCFRLVAVGALIYFLNPFDLIPDALPGGYLDDAAAAAAALAYCANQGLFIRKDGRLLDLDSARDQD